MFGCTRRSPEESPYARTRPPHRTAPAQETRVVPTRKTTSTRKTGTTATATKTKKASPKSTKKTASAPRKTASTKKVSDDEVTIDRRRAPRRNEEAEAPAPKLERRKKVARRRQIDPTTCERDYSDQEVAFMNALDEYKRKNGRMFPTCSEVLEVIRGLGYVQLTPAQRAALFGDEQQAGEYAPAHQQEDEQFEEQLA